MSTWRERIEICDPWSYYDYKDSFDNKTMGHKPMWEAPTWVGDHNRRLVAYHLLEDYCKNRSRAWMSSEADVDERKDHREYGDPAMLVSSIVSSLVGETQIFEVEGMTNEDSDAGGPATDLFKTLNEWALAERFWQKLMHNERTAVKLGDCCYVIGWDDKKQRPRVRVYDPGFYFPVLDDWSHDEDYPRKVHIAWEYCRKDANGKDKTYLRRMTWWLEETTTAIEYSWNATPVYERCMFEELEWDMDDVKGEVLDLSDASAEEITPPTDLKIDFIPVVHIPNTINETEHFGDSSLAQVMQVLDDLSSTDTDLQAASATTGSPPLGLDDTDVPRSEDGEITTYGPGQVFSGKVTLVDTSRSLDALLKLLEKLQERVATNSRTPGTVTGRIDPEKVNSGIILTMSLQPHANMIREMRLVRADKNDLIMKFIIRFMILGGLTPAYIPTHIKYGSYLPSDRQEIATIIQQLIQNHAISLETAVQLMIQANYPVDDLQKEVERIQNRDYEGASKALDASGDIDFARKLLGLPPLPADLLGEGDLGQPTDAQNAPPSPEPPPE